MSRLPHVSFLRRLDPNHVRQMARIDPMQCTCTYTCSPQGEGHAPHTSKSISTCASSRSCKYMPRLIIPARRHNEGHSRLSQQSSFSMRGVATRGVPPPGSEGETAATARRWALTRSALSASYCICKHRRLVSYHRVCYQIHHVSIKLTCSTSSQSVALRLLAAVARRFCKHAHQICTR